MNQLINLEMSRPVYFYRVTEFVTTFGDDMGKNEPYDHEEDFKGFDLLECREMAINYYKERHKGFQEDNVKYFLPFASPKDFIIGQNAAHSLTLSLIECIDNENYEYILSGEDEQTINDGREAECEILTSLGLYRRIQNISY